MIVEVPDDQGNYDASNPLVLPSKKEKKNRGKEKLQRKVVKPLTKAQRRKLVRVVESKKRKGNVSFIPIKNILNLAAYTFIAFLMQRISFTQVYKLKESIVKVFNGYKAFVGNVQLGGKLLKCFLQSKCK